MKSFQDKLIVVNKTKKMIQEPKKQHQTTLLLIDATSTILSLSDHSSDLVVMAISELGSETIEFACNRDNAQTVVEYLTNVFNL